jgi:hypothetical protein
MDEFLANPNIQKNDTAITALPFSVFYKFVTTLAPDGKQQIYEVGLRARRIRCHRAPYD